MNYNQKVDLLNQIAESYVLLDKDNTEDINNFKLLVSQFLEGYDGEPYDCKCHAEKINSIVSTHVDENTKISDDDWENIHASIRSMQSCLNTFIQENDVESVNFIEESIESASIVSENKEKPVVENMYVLPEWIDQNVFQDFLIAQKTVLDEIESDIISIEKGDEHRMGEFKRRIHTLKGEAGMMAMDDLGSVCHIIEDYIDQNVDLTAMVDILLQIKDWIESSLEAYAGGELPQPSGNTIISLFTSETSINQDNEVDDNSTEESDDNENNDDSFIKVDPVPVERDEETASMLVDFVVESEDGLSDTDEILINAEKGGFDSEMINAIFRAFHTMKGVAGFLELDDIKALAHVTETLLDKARDREIVLEGPVLDIVFDATKAMRLMTQDIRIAVDEGREFFTLNILQKLIDRIQDILDGLSGKNIGAVQAKADIQVDDKVGDILQKTTGISLAAIEDALNRQKDTGRKIGEELIASGDAKAQQIAEALRAQKNVRTTRNVKISEAIKVDADRLDRLVDMLGELVITESMVSRALLNIDISQLGIDRHLGQLDKITRELQEIGMSLRMIPIRATFQKMSRLVRDISRRSNKPVECVLSGEDTELDKTVVDNIGDPLIHMVRNAVDHGLEALPEDRIKNGKSATGRINLRAFHRGGSIYIEVEDDGRGLDKSVILKKAIDRGLISEDHQLDDQGIYSLIFKPGFSTASQVTEISGRGVGMDVVKKNVESLRGRIEIASEFGKGSRFSISLPLTLAIIDGMVVTVGTEHYIIPTLCINRSIQPIKTQIESVLGKGEMLKLNNELIPIKRISNMFCIESNITELTEGLLVVVEESGKRIALFVDNLVGQQQIVIKSLGDALKKVDGIAGGAIMANGKVGLILDVSGVVGIAST